MYEAYYGLEEKPFTILPDPDFMYWGRTHKLAYTMLEYGLFNLAGITVITGEIGCGKTTLLRHLLNEHEEDVTIGLLTNTHEASTDLLGWVLLSFGQDYSGDSKVEKFERLQAFFIDEYAAGRRVVLIIDEAQNLSVSVLEELRMLSNINSGKDVVLQLILVGQPQLKTLLQRPELVQFAQRVASDFHIKPLALNDVAGYIKARLNAAGRTRMLFAADAIELIANYSRGIPRLINVLCDTCLVYGMADGSKRISRTIVENVLRDKADFGVFDVQARKTAYEEEPTA